MNQCFDMASLRDKHRIFVHVCYCVNLSIIPLLALLLIMSRFYFSSHPPPPPPDTSLARKAKQVQVSGKFVIPTCLSCLDIMESKCYHNKKAKILQENRNGFLNYYFLSTRKPSREARLTRRQNHRAG